MLEIKDGYNIIKIDIQNYTSKKYREINNIDEDDCWCNLYLYLKNEYIVIDNYYYGMESIEVDTLYKDLEMFIKDEMNDNSCFEPIEPSFKMFFYPFGKECKNKNYKQQKNSRKDKIITLFIAFIEKETKAPSDDGVVIELYEKEAEQILRFLKGIIKDSE